MGRHYRNLDSSRLPFSYLIEHNDESVLVPAINIRSVGTIRDAIKWPQRDTRKDPVLLDQICFPMLSPFTVSRMVEGIAILKKLGAEVGDAPDYYLYEGMRINRHALERGIGLYQTTISKFLGNALVKRLEKAAFTSVEDIRQLLTPASTEGTGEWVDVAGLLVPASEVESLLDDIDNGRVDSLVGVHERMTAMRNSYEEWEWTWALSLLEKETGSKVSELTALELTAILERWKKSVAEIDYMLYEDAMKEFTLSAKTGFGIDGSDHEKREDFDAVRGNFETNPFVASILSHITRKSAIGDKLIARIMGAGKR
jgi:hypothetical protein